MCEEVALVFDPRPSRPIIPRIEQKCVPPRGGSSAPVLNIPDVPIEEMDA